jgi:hypothetical protein
MALNEQQAAKGNATGGRPRYRQTYEVEEVRGRCPIYKPGDKIVIDGQGFTEAVNLELSDAVCMRATENMWATHAWQHGPDDIVNHLAAVTGECRIACSMPGEPYTPCGYCIFRQSRERIS